MLFLAAALPWRWKGNSAERGNRGRLGGCVFRYVYNPSYPSTTLVPIQLFSLYTRPPLAPADSARQPSEAGIQIFSTEWFDTGLWLMSGYIWAEIVHWSDGPDQLAIYPFISRYASCSHGCGVQLITNWFNSMLWRDRGGKYHQDTKKSKSEIQLYFRKLGLLFKWESYTVIDHFKQVIPKAKVLKKTWKGLSPLILKTCIYFFKKHLKNNFNLFGQGSTLGFSFALSFMIIEHEWPRRILLVYIILHCITLV